MISGYLHSQDAQGNLEVWREPGLISVSTGKEVFLGQISLILPDVHVASRAAKTLKV
ncbi:MAG: hypothetical protein ABR985_19940 [Methanotrichaceae archaeon]